MAYAKNDERNGTLNNFNEYNNGSKRKSFFKRIAEALKALPEDDEDLFVEANENEVAKFRATLAELTHAADAEREAETYRDRLKTARNKQEKESKRVSREDSQNIDDLQK